MPKPFTLAWINETSPEERALAAKGFTYFKILCKLSGQADFDQRFYKTYSSWIKLALFVEENDIPFMMYLRFLSEQSKWRPSTFSSPWRMNQFWIWLKKKVSKAVRKQDKLNILKSLASEEDKALEIYEDYLASKLRLSYAGLTEDSPLDDLISVSDMLSNLHLLEISLRFEYEDFFYSIPDHIHTPYYKFENELVCNASLIEKLISYLRDGGYAETRLVDVLSQWYVQSTMESS